MERGGHIIIRRMLKWWRLELRHKGEKVAEFETKNFDISPKFLEPGYFRVESYEEWDRGDVIDLFALTGNEFMVRITEPNPKPPPEYRYVYIVCRKVPEAEHEPICE